ncbi:hypothetical protein JOC77_001002 [Peribacillus deserti]|uniref:Uncharacterized protein n=1 Tax=Peribacillus deserti TaxID=673318 RepID=A0ABS2QEL9_9BACI|nr:hypothetical protein [Peribacillus deserti]
MSLKERLWENMTTPNWQHLIDEDHFEEEEEEE